MRQIRVILFVTLACFAVTDAFALDPTRSQTDLLPSVNEYVAEIEARVDTVPADRRPVLDKFAAEITTAIAENGSSKLNFICTHNSRRSHLSQVWAQTAAAHLGIENVLTYSGGTEATACNPRTISALRRAGFSIQRVSSGTNPHYRVRFAKRGTPIEAFSKVYSDTQAGNPDSGFIAALCCSQADQECPVVTGAVARIPLHYEDPKVADDTPAEAAKYDERCRQIAIEMFYVMNQVARKTRS